MFGDTRVIFQRNEAPKPSSGSVLDHVGFSVADLDATIKGLEADGAKVVTPARDVAGLFKLAFVEDPWGVRLEVVQDAAKLGLHHVHVRAPDPSAALAWYTDKFGGMIGKPSDQPFSSKKTCAAQMSSGISNRSAWRSAIFRPSRRISTFLEERVATLQMGNTLFRQAQSF